MPSKITIKNRKMFSSSIGLGIFIDFFNKTGSEILSKFKDNPKLELIFAMIVVPSIIACF